MASEKKVWLITGASAGIGTEIALAALRAGHRVIGTARDPEKASKDHPEFQELGGKWLRLDVTDPHAQDIVSSAVEDAGRIDVLVNNNGGSVRGIGLLEDLPIEDFQHCFQTNTLGPIKCIRGVLPTMRAQKSGTIINHGSVLGTIGSLGSGAYAVSKFGLDGVSENCAVELAPFNIRTIHLTTGFFSTSMPLRGLVNGAVPSEPYLQGPAASMLAAYAPGMELDKLPGDPKKLATKLVETVDGAGVGAGKENPHWIPFGKDANWCMRRKALRLLRDADTLEELSNSVDMDGFDEKDRAWPNLVKDILL